MTSADFKRSLSKRVPPPSLATPLLALWWAGKDDWDKAHALVMNDNSSHGAWVHAYLHRVEGDLANARYWYARAGRPPASDSLTKEWEEIATALLR